MRVTALGNRTMFLQGRIGFSICIVHNDLALDAGIPAQAIVSQQKSEYNGDASVDHGRYLPWQPTRFQASCAF